MGMGGREKEKRDTGAVADGGGEDKKGRRAEGRRSSSCVSPPRVLAGRFRARHGSHPCHDNSWKRRSHWLIPSQHSPRFPLTSSRFASSPPRRLSGSFFPLLVFKTSPRASSLLLRPVPFLFFLLLDRILLFLS